MVQDMKDFGKKINKMEMVSKLGLMELVIKEIMLKARSMEWECLLGQMAAHTMVNSLITTLKDKVIIFYV